MYKKIKTLIKELKLEEDVYLLGYRDDVNYIIASFDIAVIASKGSEGSSRVLYEYMAMKKPVVATDAGIIPEIIKNEENGLIVPKDNPAALASGILTLLKDKEKGSLFSSKAYLDLIEIPILRCLARLTLQINSLQKKQKFSWLLKSLRESIDILTFARKRFINFFCLSKGLL